jgi:hypothetical protein
VSVVEQEVEGEKLVTRHILEQTRRNGDDLAAGNTRLDGLDQNIDQRVTGLDQKIDRLETRLDNRTGSLERALPKIVGDLVREVFRERDER